jgi:uncharacterized protein YndB with AHSA1/START domain
MEFTAKDDLDVPIEAAFDLLSEYDVFERMAMRRGVEVRRHNPESPIGIGSKWDVDFEWRGKDVPMKAEITKFERPDFIEIEAVMPGMDVTVQFDLVALSKKRTRLHFKATSSAKTLPMRLLLQSLKLARSNIDKKMQDRVSLQCRNLEERYYQAA